MNTQGTSFTTFPCVYLISNRYEQLADNKNFFKVTSSLFTSIDYKRKAT